MKRTVFPTLALSLLLSASAFGQRSQVLDVFPDSTWRGDAGFANETTEFTTEYSPSISVWDSRLDERAVFQVEMHHKQDLDRSFKLRIGKGGQVYSLRGPFGESVPPSWRPAGTHVSPWNDEVWQFVAVCSKYNGIKSSDRTGETQAAFSKSLKDSGFDNTFFIHNSGAYIPGESKLKSLYCPLLASEIDRDNHSFRMLNWGLVPQIKTIHRSSLLYYTQVRDAGDGVIELTWVVHNFSNRDDIVFDHLNAPWGGTRISSLPLRYVSSPEGILLERKGLLDETHKVVDVRKTGGWNISCASDADDSPSLALVYGRDRHLEREHALKDAGKPHCQFLFSYYRDWRASEPFYKNQWKDWATRPEASFRNYDVVEFIPKLRIEPGRTIWFRSFLVVGRKDQVMKTATSLVDQVDYGLLNFDAKSSPMKSVSLGPGVKFQVFSKPVDGSQPLFAIEYDQTGQQVITTDPYFFVEKERLGLELPSDDPHYDYYSKAIGYSMDRHNSDWKSLVGYAYKSKPDKGNWQKLSSILSAEHIPELKVGSEVNEFHREVWVKVASPK